MVLTVGLQHDGVRMRFWRYTFVWEFHLCRTRVGKSELTVYAGYYLGARWTLSIDYAAIDSVPITPNNRPLARAERVVFEAHIADVDEGQILLGDTGQMARDSLEVGALEYL